MCPNCIYFNVVSLSVFGFAVGLKGGQGSRLQLLTKINMLELFKIGRRIVLVGVQM